jgi:general secretion pathway protein G
MTKRNKIIVVVVIFLLAFIALLLFLNLFSETRDGGRSYLRVKAQSQLDAVTKALEMFRNDYGAYPSESEGLDRLLKDPKGPYIDPTYDMKDPWGHTIHYHVLQDGTFSLTSFGADGKPGGTGQDADIVVH